MVVVAWISSHRGLLVLGLSFVLGLVLYLLLDSYRLWRIRRSARDVVDLMSVGAFFTILFGVASVLRIYIDVFDLGAGAVAILSGYKITSWLLRIDDSDDVRLHM